MSIEKLYAGLVGDPLNTSGTQLADSVNSLIDAHVPHLKVLPAAVNVQIDTTYNVISFYAGWQALSSAPTGGGRFVWNSTLSKSTHNGVTHYAPEALAAWAGTQTDIATLLNWAGTGNGVFVRVSINTDALDLTLGGVVYGITQADQKASAKKVIDVCATSNYTWKVSGITRLLSALEFPSNCRGVGPGSFYLDPIMTLGTPIGGKARGVYAQNKNILSLDGIKFFSATAALTQSVSMCIANTNNIDIKNCEFSDFGDATYYTQGLLIFGGNHVYVDYNKFYRCSGDGLAFSNGTDDFTAIGNKTEDCDDWGIVATIACKNGVIAHNNIINCGSTATGSDRCQDLTIGPNIIDGCEHGVRITEFVNTGDLNRNITVIVGSIKNCLTAGVSIETTRGKANINVSAGTIDTVTAGQGIRIVNAEGVVVNGLSIKNTSADGILEHASASGMITGSNIITNNNVDICTYGIRQLVTSGILNTSIISRNNISNASVARIALVNYEGTQRYAGPMTHTPIAKGATTEGVGTYTVQSTKYYFDGDMVDANISISWTAHTGTGGLVVTLPAPIADLGQRVPCTIYYDGLNVGAGKQCVGFVGTSGDVLAIRAADPAGGAAATFAFDTAASINVHIRYRRA